MQRRLETNLIRLLKESPLWKTHLMKDCTDQNVFLAIRDNRIDLYHKGGKLFGFDNTGFKTHIKYAAVISSHDKDYLTQDDLRHHQLALDFEENYTRIKENCANYSGLESSGVSEIYHKHSCLKQDADVVVLDIEVSFGAENKKQDRIDILLFNTKKRTLRFVEAKHFSNSEIWSKGRPKVIGQIARYEKQIQNRKEHILKQYKEQVEIINDIFGLQIPFPERLDEKVTLLIFGFDNDQKKGRLKRLIKNNSEFKNIMNYNKGNVKKINPVTIWNSAKIITA